MKKPVRCVVLVAFVGCLCLVGCTDIPSGLEPITGFDLDRYLGQWYEVARLDHSFERDMSNVSAYYSRGDKGEIRVINRGFDEKSGKWKDILGRGHFAGDPKVGSLKVSFFGPFYGGYHIITGQSYRCAMITGLKSYLWFIQDRTWINRCCPDLVSKASDWGFETDN
jgi:apolipoprotein D and lipocalin family protein